MIRYEVNCNNSAFGTKFAGLGLVIGVLGLFEFIAELLRLRAFRVFAEVSLAISIINTWILLPIWLVVLGKQLSIVKSSFVDWTTMDQNDEHAGLQLVPEVDHWSVSSVDLKLIWTKSLFHKTKLQIVFNIISHPTNQFTDLQTGHRLHVYGMIYPFMIQTHCTCTHSFVPRDPEKIQCLLRLAPTRTWQSFRSIDWKANQRCYFTVCTQECNQECTVVRSTDIEWGGNARMNGVVVWLWFALFIRRLNWSYRGCQCGGQNSKNWKTYS